MLEKALFASLVLIFVSGCATRPESISASYVSHEKYVDGSCPILATQLSDTQEKLKKVSRLQDDKANGDAVGVFLLGIPFSQLSGDHAAEVAKLKGECEAIETAQIKNKCKAIQPVVK